MQGAAACGRIPPAVHIPFRIQRLLVTVACLAPVAAMAQGGGLEGEFSKLNAKERTRIAQQEENAAREDAQFQAIMQGAEELFREQRYEEAMARFEQARDLRPYNVYPRVKIQDLQALIAQRNAEAAAHTVEEEPPAPPPQAATRSHEAPVGHPAAETRTPTSQPGEPTMPPPQVQAVRPDTIRREPVPHPEVAAPFVEGERITKEGRAVVLERSVLVEGRPTVFRKVMHPWGETVYFKDGKPVPEREWNAVFGSR